MSANADSGYCTPQTANQFTLEEDEAKIASLFEYDLFISR
jgi:hypothetical protein